MNTIDFMRLGDWLSNRLKGLLIILFAAMFGYILLICYMIPPNEHTLSYTVILIGFILGGIVGLITTSHYGKRDLKKIFPFLIISGIFLTVYIVSILKLVALFSNNSAFENVLFGLRAGLCLCALLFSGIAIFLYRNNNMINNLNNI